MKLSSIQNSFLDSVFSENKSLSYILPTHSNAEDTIKIYKDTINAQLINTLKIVFPICESMLGTEFFSAMSFQYIKNYPSESSNLNEYGKYMSVFMKDFKPLEEYPYFSDIASMEYNYDEVKRSAYTQIDDKDLSNFEESQYNSLIFKPAESLKLFSSPFKVAEIWKMYEDNDIKELDISTDTTYNVIYKVYSKTIVKEITYFEYEFLNASKKDLSLEEIVENYPEIIDNLGGIIASILQNKIIQKIEVK
jgi:hypothetical protein